MTTYSYNADNFINDPWNEPAETVEIDPFSNNMDELKISVLQAEIKDYKTQIDQASKFGNYDLLEDLSRKAKNNQLEIASIKRSQKVEEMNLNKDPNIKVEFPVEDSFDPCVTIENQIQPLRKMYNEMRKSNCSKEELQKAFAEIRKLQSQLSVLRVSKSTEMTVANFGPIDETPKSNFSSRRLVNKICHKLDKSKSAIGKTLLAGILVAGAASIGLKYINQLNDTTTDSVPNQNRLNELKINQ